MDRQRLLLMTISSSRVAIVSACFAWCSLSTPFSIACGSDFAKEREFVRTFCIGCHAGEHADGKLDLEVLIDGESLADRHVVWKGVMHRVEVGEMPPRETDLQPTDSARIDFSRGVLHALRDEARLRAGDPGFVPVRRLNHAEYNATIRDLIGVDIQPAREFPVDPANEAGFDNSAESLTTSAALLRKYLEVARRIADHMVLTPTGMHFAPRPMTTDTDRDQYCVQRIVDFYRRQPIDLAEYYYAAWILLHPPAGEEPRSIEAVAREQRISPRYLDTLVDLLGGPESEKLLDASSTRSPLQDLRDRFQALNAAGSDPDSLRAAAEKLRDHTLMIRALMEPHFDNLEVDGIHNGSQALVLWKNRQYAEHRRRFVPEAISKLSEKTSDADVVSILSIPEEEALRQAWLDDATQFCSVIPDAFFVSERGRDYLGVPKEKQEKGRLLSAGFHSMMGYFRDDQPLYELVLSDAEREELDRLWRELDFVTQAPMRQYQGFLWFERTDHRFLRDETFDFARPENKDATSEAMIRRLSELYLSKARGFEPSDVAIEAIEHYFRDMNEKIRAVERQRTESRAKHLEAVVDFAKRACRGYGRSELNEEIGKTYDTLVQQDGLSHEEAIQDLVVQVLLSPEFCFRLDLMVGEDERRALSDLELANRLSYLFWTSMPDERLMRLVDAGKLHDREVLFSEIDRMITDERFMGFATEFTGQWLDIRRFQEFNSVDRVQFPQFTDGLRDAMFEEPIRWMADLFQRDGSVLECLDSDHTWLNRELAAHYGIEPKDVRDDDVWWKEDGMRERGRGGLLPMAVFLTQNSPGLRTSPVKRGYWVVRRLLGENIPAPPPDVPQLPAEEASLGEQTLRQALEKHRENASCAGCHERFDSIGLVFENFGPIGERRERDLGGRLIDSTATFPSGETGEGIEGLRTYIQQHRQADFVNQMTGKLLAYALGRSLQLSDDLLLDEMAKKLQEENFHGRSLLRTIVLSPQFMEKRGSQAAPAMTGVYQPPSDPR